jgi:hypothetical protein
MNTHEVLVAARNLIDRQGWCQQPGENFAVHGRPQCALGALDLVEPNWIAAGVPHALYRHLPGDLGSVVEFNDEPGRTKDEVLALFDKAIAATAPEPADPCPDEAALDTPLGALQREATRNEVVAIMGGQA